MGDVEGTESSKKRKYSHPCLCDKQGMNKLQVGRGSIEGLTLDSGI